MWSFIPLPALAPPRPARHIFDGRAEMGGLVRRDHASTMHAVYGSGISSHGFITSNAAAPEVRWSR